MSRVKGHRSFRPTFPQKDRNKDGGAWRVISRPFSLRKQQRRVDIVHIEIKTLMQGRRARTL